MVMVLDVVALLMLGSVITGGSAGPTDGKPRALPSELQGIWTVVSGEEDGRKMKFARGEEDGDGYTTFNEPHRPG
jgi:hypothetical protein